MENIPLNFYFSSWYQSFEAWIICISSLNYGWFRLELFESKSFERKSTPIIVQSEGSLFKAGITLNEANYDLRSQIMEMDIVEKEKLSFIHGNSQPPTNKDDGYKKWYANNQKVKKWLLLSMSLEIMKWYIHLPTTQGIWKALSKDFYDGIDEL